MTSSGIDLRLRRLSGPGRRFFLLALDHGLPAGPMPGIERPAELVTRLRGSPVTGIVANPGILSILARNARPDVGLVAHLSAGTLLGSRPTSKVLATSVERGVALGADAISVQIHFGDRDEDRMVADAGAVVDDATRLGTPTLVMAHARSSPGTPSLDPMTTRHAVRAAAELGATLVQTSFEGEREDLASLVSGCPAPLLFAGGPRTSSEATLSFMQTAMAAGAAGVSVGRSLFQHPDPLSFAKAIGEVVLGNRRASVPEVS